MVGQVVIGVHSQEAANLIKQELATYGIQADKLDRNTAIRFGMKLGAVEVSVHEFIEIVEAAPKIVDAIFDVTERFRDRKEQLRVFVNGQPVEVANKQTLLALLDTSGITKPKIFQGFERNRD